jgi:hypothetical protein
VKVDDSGSSNINEDVCVPLALQVSVRQTFDAMVWFEVVWAAECVPSVAGT